MSAPPRPSSGEVRKIRRRLWQAQDALCHYCHKPTILPEDLLAEYLPLEQIRAEFSDEMNALHQQLLAKVPEFRRRWFNEVATVDHVIEQALGGTWDEDNLVMACYPCNHDRGVRFHRRLRLLRGDEDV